MQRYINNVETQFGAPVAFANISVNIHGGGPASLFSTNGPGPIPLTNPFQADANGNFAFYAPDGRYDITITGPNIQPYTVTDIILNNAGYGPDNTGPTASRPATPTLNQEFYDTTLGQPIWCTQVSPPLWVNAAGVNV